MKQILFDWSKDTLYCFQRFTHIFLVDALVRGIEAGDEIKLPSIAQLSDDEYFLIRDSCKEDDSVYGGHHRMMGLYLAGKNFNFSPTFYPYRFFKEKYVPIQDVELSNYRDCTLKWLRKYRKDDFYLRAKNYPNIDWEGWGLRKPKNLVKNF